MISDLSGSLRKCVPDSSEVILFSLEATDLVQLLGDRLGAYPASLVQVGQAAMGALLLRALFDDSECAKVETQWRSEGAFGNLYADAFGLGQVRSAVSVPQAAVQDLKTGLGPGLFQVRRVLKSQDLHPFTGIVPGTGFIGEDIANYLEKSEQKNCGISLSVELGWEEGRTPSPITVKHARAYLVHILPQNEEKKKDALLASWDRHIRELGPLSQWEMPGTATQVSRNIFSFLLGKEVPAKNLVWEEPLQLFCPCSRERAEKALSLLSEKEREEMKAKPEDRELEFLCDYCGSKYLIQL